ncbi:plasmid mobilization protein MobA [Duganella hordei]|uniref:plasmid mobilization protein MobA n=1 Tax=Duganella hordei TaxID=2865934 RepID=UPI0030E92AF4
MAKIEQRRKSKLVMVRVSPEELSDLQARAAAVVKTVPDYLRSCALARETRAVGDQHIIHELRRLGESQRRLYAENGGASGPELTAVLLAILAAINRLGT